MIKGYFEKRYDRMCDSIYLIDDEKNTCFTLAVTVHEMKEGDLAQSSDFSRNNIPTEILRGLAEALTQGGLMPKDATSAELKATKYHLEDMRKLTLKTTPGG